jgi:hypothetical protein
MLTGEVAQSAEQWTHKPLVDGSSPSLATQRLSSAAFLLSDIIYSIYYYEEVRDGVVEGLV